MFRTLFSQAPSRARTHLDEVMAGDGVRQISWRGRQNFAITAGACSGANSLSQRQEKGIMREQAGVGCTFTLNGQAGTCSPPEEFGGIQ